MTKQKILLSLLLMGGMGMVKAQTVEIAPNGNPATHKEVLSTGGTVTFKFDGAKVTATGDYGAETEFTATETATPLTFGETAVETIQLRTPNDFDYAVGSYVAKSDLDFSKVKGNSNVGEVIRPYVATGCSADAITLEGKTIINAGSAFVMCGEEGWYCVPVTSSTSTYTNKFQGSATESTTSDGTQYALSSAGTFKKVSSGVSIPVQRAYFVPETASAAKAASFALDFDGTTAIESIEAEPSTGSSQTLADGKYLKDGQLFIVRGGVKYNVNGIIIK